MKPALDTKVSLLGRYKKVARMVCLELPVLIPMDETTQIRLILDTISSLVPHTI